MTRRQPEIRIQKQLRSDGALCLSFANAGHGARPPLDTYADLLAWGLATGAVDAADADLLERAAAERPGVARGVARRALTLRARLERIVGATADGGKATAADLEAFNLELGHAFTHRRLAVAGGSYRWTWSAGPPGGEANLDRVLWPVLLAAAELLASRDLARLRRCPGKGCGLLFLARRTGGKPRKWCGSGCRDRATSLSHYHRKIKPKRDRETRRKQARHKARLAGYGESEQPDGQGE